MCFFCENPWKLEEKTRCWDNITLKSARDVKINFIILRTFDIPWMVCLLEIFTSSSWHRAKTSSGIRFARSPLVQLAGCNELSLEVILCNYLNYVYILYVLDALWMPVWAMLLLRCLIRHTIASHFSRKIQPISLHFIWSPLRPPSEILKENNNT